MTVITNKLLIVIDIYHKRFSKFKMQQLEILKIPLYLKYEWNTKIDQKYSKCFDETYPPVIQIPVDRKLEILYLI